MSRRDSILAKVGTIETLPAAAAQAVQMLQDPDVAVADVTKIIEHDPGLASNILRLANSAYFGFPRSVNSVRDAIVRLGLKQVTRTIMASAVAPMTRRPVKGYDLSAGGLWEHSLSVAVGVDQLAEVLGIKAPEYAFTAALLHDVGKIALGTFIEVDAGPIMKLAFEEHLPFEVAEQRVLGIDHAEVGAVLLESWHLPVSIVEACRWHHEPERVSDPELKEAVDLIHTADSLSLMCGIGMGSDGLNYRPSKEVKTRLGLTTATTENVMCRILDVLEELREVFVVDEGGA
jgi:putative nucleotidyltransferase with HDIG domain